MPMKNPPHPGDFIWTEIIEPADLSVTAAAGALQGSRPALSSLLNGKADLSWDMALRMSRQFASTLSTVTITKDYAGRYFASLCLDESVEAFPRTGASVGIDLGINRLATLSNGERVANPRHLGKKLARLL